MNTILWNINVDAGDTYLIGDYSFFDTQPVSFKRYPKKRKEAVKLLSTTEVQRLIDISEGWYILERENNQWVYNDLRFGVIPIDDIHSQFVFRYILKEKDGHIIATEDRPKPENAQAILTTLWERILGN